MKYFDPLIILLFFGCLIWTLIAVGCAYWRPDDNGLFTFVTSIATGFSGCLFGLMKGGAPEKGNHEHEQSAK